MIFVERKSDAPASLSTPAALAQAAAAETYYDTWIPGQPAFDSFTHYRGYDVHQALRKDFNRKCGYCEQQLEKGAFEVEHYRPKGGVEGCDHSGYWWLALEWTNLLPTCAACNKAFHQHIVTADMTLEAVEAMQSIKPSTLYGKHTQFPVGGNRLTAKSYDHESELPRLIDPTRTNPEPELRWRNDVALSVVEPSEQGGINSPLGEATIHCVALNRSDLVLNRTQILERLKAQRISIFEDLEKDVAAAAGGGASVYILLAVRRVEDMKLAAKPDQPFSAMAKAFVRDLRIELVEWAKAQGFQAE